ncbi:hypothetical protein [Mesobacterium pallidum]|uniref:hypothetical protein n=1 Tax=Mesobacterium pallidum TaxID=2872037 RepID=UPI001EE3043B|nr:hypothetical protein [Mesobacterium pallidum]
MKWWKLFAKPPKPPAPVPRSEASQEQRQTLLEVQRKRRDLEREIEKTMTRLAERRT